MAQAEISGLNAQPLAHGEKRVVHQFLRHYTERRARGAVIVHHVVAHHCGAAAAGPGESGKDADKRGFARAIRAQQGKKFALLHFQVNALQSMQTAEMLV